MKIESSEEKKRRVFMISGAVVTIALVCIFIVLFIFSNSDNTPNSNVARAKDQRLADSKLSIGEKSSPEYKKKIEEYDDLKADEALKIGASFISTPVIDPKPLIQKKEEKAPQKEHVPVTQRSVRKTVQKEDDALTKRAMEDLQNLDSRLVAMRSPGQITYTFYPEKDDVKISTKTSSKRTKLINNKEEDSQGNQDSPPSLMALTLHPGNILYAVTDVGLNSDVPSAVLATVLQGKFKNYKLIGQFQRFEERMVLSFFRAISPEGQETTLEAYAIDPGTTEAHVASRVNTHWFDRWGGLVASAFLSGLGEAKRYSGASTYANNSNAQDQMAWADYSLSDQAWIAAGKVGEKAATQFDKYFDRPPTVYLNSGSQIGVLITQVKK